MKFTDRFIKVPVKAYDISLKEMTGKEELYDSFEMINPLDVVSYRPSYSADDVDNEACINIVFKNGDKSLIYLSIDEFEKLLNNFGNK